MPKVRKHQTILVTGGAGFIGSAVVRQFIQETDLKVINVDKLTYAGDLATVEAVANDSRYVFEKVDICDTHEMERVFKQHQPDAIMHLAAESHVDRSIDGPVTFIQTNIVGTCNLLEVARRYWNGLAGEKQANFVFHHISTDEVYGSLGDTGLFTEESQYQPSSPYSASKASSDHLVRAWHHTYGIPTVVTNCSNNYGPYQFPEKLIPLMILNAVAGKPLPVYGKGNNIRDWLYVDDHAEALRLVLQQGVVGETYNIGGHNELSNLQVVEMICDALDALLPAKNKTPRRELITFVEDRPGHDLRYAIDASKIQAELGWQPKETFSTGLRKTIQWYLEHLDWGSHSSAQYQGQRLGLEGIK